jgi:hypothetical protein
MTMPVFERAISRLFNRFDAQRWRDRAGEARADATRLVHPDARRLMVEIAMTYDRLATTAEEGRLT